MSRKNRLKRNLGGTTAQEDPRFNEPFFDGPPLAELRTAIVFPERLIRQVLLDEVERLSKDEDELRRLFEHFFTPTTSAAERESYVNNFLASPPRVVMGYPRATGDMPVFAIILTSDDEEEGDQVLSDYVGETRPGENPPGGEDQEYEGIFCTQVNSIQIFAEHPDVTLYLYHFAKLALVGAREALHNAGMISPSYSGAELSPHDIYLPDNIFGRVLNVHYKTLMTVPKLYTHRDGRRLRLAGIFRKDVVVDGIRGGVSSYEASLDVEDDDG